MTTPAKKKMPTQHLAPKVNAVLVMFCESCMQEVVGGIDMKNCPCCKAPLFTNTRKQPV